MFIIVFATVGYLHHLGRAETWYGDGNLVSALPFSISSREYMLKYMGKLYLWFSTCCLPNPKDVISLCGYNSEIWCKRKELTLQLKRYRSDLELAPIEIVLPVFTPENISTCFLFCPSTLEKNLKTWPCRLICKQWTIQCTAEKFHSFGFCPYRESTRVLQIFVWFSSWRCTNCNTWFCWIHSRHICEPWDLWDSRKWRSRPSTEDKENTKVEEPIFPPKLWSVYDRVLNDEPRITNMLEGLAQKI